MRAFGCAIFPQPTKEISKTFHQNTSIVRWCPVQPLLFMRQSQPQEESSNECLVLSTKLIIDQLFGLRKGILVFTVWALALPFARIQKLWMVSEYAIHNPLQLIHSEEELTLETAEIVSLYRSQIKLSNALYWLNLIFMVKAFTEQTLIGITKA